MPRLKLLPVMSLGCIVFLSFCVVKGHTGTSGGRSYRQINKNTAFYNGGENVDYPRAPRQYSSSNMKPHQIKHKLRNTGLSAWGIIAIILSLVFIGFAIYYFYLLYPIFCKKERRYNSIELVAV